MKYKMYEEKDLVLPDLHDSKLAEESREALASYLKSTKKPSIQCMKPRGKSTKIDLPIPALELLLDILAQMAKGNTVTLVPTNVELTTQEAADLLSVSRPHLVKLLENKKIPHRKVGTQRRVLAKDILMYKKHIDNERLKTLKALSKQAQDLDMGYK